MIFDFWTILGAIMFAFLFGIILGLAINKIPPKL